MARSTENVETRVVLGRLTADDPRHGTDNGYRNQGCRCEACRAAFANYKREMNHRLGYSVPRAEFLASISSVREGELRCFKCRRWLPDASFPQRKSNIARRGKYEWCTTCGTAAKRRYRASLAQRERANQKVSR